MTDRNEKRARMLEKVRKLLAMARDGRGNAQEEETAMRQAMKLMTEYGISEAEADMAAINAGEMVFGESSIRPDGKDDGRPIKQCPTWAGTLAVGCAKFTDTFARRRMTTRGEVMVFQGEKEDVLLARWLFGVLVDSIQREHKKSGWTGRSDSNAFRMAAASTLHRRLEKMAQEREVAYAKAAETSGSMALVVVDKKLEIMEERFGKVKYRRSRAISSSNYGAASAGHVAGSRINIPNGRPIHGGSDAPLLKG